MSFKNTLEVLTALKDKISALKVTVADEEAAAFERVEIFDMTDLAAALEELRVFKARACFIILDTERFENEGGRGTKLRSQQTRSVAILLTDRNYGKRQKALIGSETGPGILELKDLLLNGEAEAPEKAIIGKLIDGIVCQPTIGTIVRIEGKERDQIAARLAYEQDVELLGGFSDVRLGPGPTR